MILGQRTSYRAILLWIPPSNNVVLILGTVVPIRFVSVIPVLIINSTRSLLQGIACFFVIYFLIFTFEKPVGIAVV